MNKIEEKMQTIKKTKKIGLMGHIIAGYPDMETAFEAAAGICEGGADFLEVQFPFSDPTADGAAIEEACYKSIESGFLVSKGFELVKRLSQNFGTVVFIMTYANILYRYGVENFVRKAKENGAEGLIVPDMPLENDENLNNLCEKYELANIFVAAPGADKKRIKKLSDRGSGILYTVVRRGITGKKTEIDDEIVQWLNLVKNNSRLPVAAGFGIQSKKQIKELTGKADIAVIGSFFVKTINESLEKKWNVKERLFNVTKSLLN